MLVKTVLPQAVLQPYRAARLVYRARRLAVAAQRRREPSALVELVFGQDDFRPLQVRAEIRALLELLGEDPPSRVLEIGSALGGTAFLFAQIAPQDATLVLMDHVWGYVRRAAIRCLSQRNQRVVCVRADSHDAATVARVRNCFDGSSVDFLFIDGDHSYAGIESDFHNYSALVRRGGLIAFHDIVPDHCTRFGRRTPNDAGEVFRFWRELRARFPDATAEIIEDPQQDACGIGVLRLPE